MRLTKDKRAAGWPEAFKIGELAWLQYPPEGTAEQRVSARRRRFAFEAAIKDAIGAGTLQADSTVEHHTRDVLAGYLDPFHFNIQSGISRRGVPRYKSVQFDVTVARITRAGFAHWWAQQREPASEHIAAWLGREGESPSLTAAASGVVQEAWSRGLKRVAWEVAKRLYEAEGTISGPALWDAIVADQRVKTRDKDIATLKNSTTSLVGGEVSAKAKTIKTDWRKQLAEAMKS